MKGTTSPREYLAVALSLLARLRRWWAPGVVGLAVGLSITVVLALSTHRLYRSEALLTYEGGAQGVMGGDGISQRSMAARVNDMITSRQRLEALINDMKLYRSIVDKRGIVEAIDEMHRHMKVSTGEGYSYRVSYDGDSRDLAKDVLERLLDGVIGDEHQRLTQQTGDTRHFLQSERQRADDDLKAKESALSAFLAKHPQLAGEVGAASSGGLIRAADRDRSEVSGGEVASLEMQAAQIEESLAALGSSTAGVPGAPPDAPGLVAAEARAQTELQAARSDLIDKQARLTNEHPDVKTALRRVAVAEADVRRAQAALAAARVQMPVHAPLPAAADDTRAAALRRALAAVRQQIAASRGRSSAPRAEMPKSTSSMVEIDTQWTRLNREVSEARERQTQLQSKQFQAELAATLTAAGEGGQLVIADRPLRPLRPVAGGRFKIVLLGTIGSMLLALLLVSAFAAFDDRLYGSSDIERVLGDGIVIVIPIAQHKMLPLDAAEAGDEEGGRASG
jgi:hypothetical protein